MNRSDQVRQALAAGPASMDAIHAAVGGPRDTLRYLMHQMRRDDLLVYDGEQRPAEWSLGRAPMPEAQRIAHLREIAVKGRQSLQEARRALKATRVPPKTTLRRVADLSVANARALKAAPVIEHIRTETLEEFHARGGQTQVLQSWESSEANRFKRIGRAV